MSASRESWLQVKLLFSMKFDSIASDKELLGQALQIVKTNQACLSTRNIYLVFNVCNMVAASNLKLDQRK